MAANPALATGITLAKVAAGGRLAPVSQSAIDATIAEVKRDYAKTVGVKVSTADGGTARIFVDWRYKQLHAAGYTGWRRSAGIEAGAEILFDLSPDD
jgi:hypothetical protein